jgi:hypothetical protein
VFSRSPVRVFGHGLLVLPIALSFGCSDAPTALTPRNATTPLDLLAPVVVTVANTDDAGAGSLRQAVIDAPTDAVIRFDAAIAGQTVVLTTGQISIPKNVTIEGPISAGMTISGNLVSGVFRVMQGANVVLRNLSIVNGRSLKGGGVLNEGTVMIDHTLLANNEAEDGGGLFMADVATLATIVNSTISGNVATFEGGGLVANRAVIIRNSTIAENTSTDGGGITFLRGTLDVRNSIIANNIDSDPVKGSRPNCSISAGEVLVLTGTNLSNDNGCGTGPAMVIANPRLAPIASNGGPTKTYALLLGSPAIDGGSVCSEATDQRYVARPQGVTCDIGAFELDKFASVTLTIAPNVAVNTKTGVATVTGTATCSAPGVVPIDVALSQTQKTKGKFSTIIQAAGATSVDCVGTSSWSVTLTPSTGEFENGAATGTAKVGGAGGFLPATVTSTLKAFAVK